MCVEIRSQSVRSRSQEELSRWQRVHFSISSKQGSKKCQRPCIIIEVTWHFRSVGLICSMYMQSCCPMHFVGVGKTFAQSDGQQWDLLDCFSLTVSSRVEQNNQGVQSRSGYTRVVVPTSTQRLPILLLLKTCIGFSVTQMQQHAF